MSELKKINNQKINFYSFNTFQNVIHHSTPNAMIAISTLRKIAALLFLTAFCFTAKAQVVTPFTIRYQTTQKGGIIYISNSSITCNAVSGTGSGTCLASRAQAAPGGTAINNSFEAQYIDIDNDATTFMSSSDSLTLPICSEISFAGLYWGAENQSGGNNWNNRNSVKLKVNNGAYVNLTADQSQINTTGYNSYHCFKDITAIATAAGLNARYTLANIATRVGGTNRFGGWTIVIVYKNDLQLMRNLTVFNGLSNVSGGFPTTNIPISGFLTPLSGPVNIELGMVVYDGDRSSIGDSVLFNGAGTFRSVADALNPANDVFNSTFSRNGVATPFRNPSYNNSLGYDADIFFPNNATKTFIGNNATSAIIRQKTGGETFLTQVVTSAIDVYEPSLRVNVTVSDINGGTVAAGDILEYTFTAKNIGSDPSVNTFVIDTLEGNADYVPGSIVILSGPNAGVKTDAGGDDQGEYDPINRVVRVRVGTGANAVVGGSVNNSPTGADSTRFKFRITASNNCVLLRCDSIIDSRVYIFGTGNISGNTFVDEGTMGTVDASGCPLPGLPLVPVNIASCPLPTASATTVCEGATATLSIVTTPNASYTWSGPGGFSSTVQNPTRTNMTPAITGSYTVTTRVSATCLYTTGVNVGIHLRPSAATSFTNIACKGVQTGTATGLGAGSAPFTYSWNTVPVRTTQTITGLGIGTYTVTVIDSYSCTRTANAVITEPAAFLIAQIATFTNAGCDGGSATATASGGANPIQYSWQPIGTSGPTISGVSAGTYTVTARDNSNCTAIANVVITSVPPLSLTITKNNVSCNGGTNGSATATATGGIAPYSFLWAGGGQTTQTITGLAAGTYTVTVRDAQSCTKTSNIVVTQPSAISASIISSVNILCADIADGVISASATGGTGALSYSWSPVAGTNSSLTGLANAGTYTVTVTDVNNCTGTASGIITKVAQLVSTTAVETVTCFGASDATLSPVTIGGTSPYRYLWLPNGTTNTNASGLPMGTYTVITTDFNGCNDTSLAFVVQPPELEIGINTIINNSTCNQPNGEISTTASGGTGPYTYAWSPFGGTNSSATGLAAGAYTITVTDDAGCNKSAVIPLEDLSGPQITFISKTDVGCFGAATGSILASFTSGTPGPYSIIWTPSSVTSTTVLTTGSFSALNLPAGNYTVRVTDPSGCVGVEVETINQPLDLQAVGSQVNAPCRGLTGSATVLAFGGTTSYTYSWNTAPVQTRAQATGLLAGNYQVTVTDANSCTEVVTYTITQPTSLTVSISPQQNSTCFGFNNGQATAAPVGGTPNYSYNWQPGNNSSPSVVGMAPNTYTLTVNDSKGCQAQATTVITEPALLTLGLSTFTNVSCFGGSNGTASLSATGGTPVYTYTWSGGVGSTTNASITGLANGNYFVTITDNNGCLSNTNVNISQPPQLNGAPFVTNQTRCNLSNGEATVAVSGGTSPFAYSWAPGGMTTQSISGLAPNNYSVTVTDNNGCSHVSNSITVNTSVATTATMNNTIVSCFNGSDGTATVISNGTLPINYVWTPNVSVTLNAANLSQGTYNVTITDAQGCIASTSTTVTQPIAPLTINGGAITNANCYGTSTGGVTPSVAGGTPTYNYFWIPGGSTSPSPSNFSAGDYAVRVTDSKGCTATSTFTVGENAQIVPIAVATPPEFICPGQTAVLSASSTGGSGNYIYTWDNGLGTGNTHSVTPTTTTTYIVTASDGDPSIVGCVGLSSEVVVFVSDPNLINLTAFTSTTICEGDSAIISSQLTGAVTDFDYTWSNGITSAESFYVFPDTITTYTLNIINVCGQTKSASVVIGVTKIPQIDILPKSATRCGPQSINFTNSFEAPAGTEYKYLWNFDNKFRSTSPNADYTFDQSGNYRIILRIEDRGCLAIDTTIVPISISDPPVASFNYEPEEISQFDPLVYFENTSQQAHYYKWYFTEAEKDSSFLKDPSYQYPDTGNFQVKLIAYKVVGDSTCRDTTIQIIRVNPEITIYVPNTFTPNDDKINGLFYAKGTNLKEIYMEIYDRWGVRIYKTPDPTDLKAGWDGNYKGTFAKQDVYVYRIVAKDYRNRTLQPYVGTVTLMR